MERPRSVSFVVVALALLAVVCVLLGLVAKQVSACCGSPDPPDGTPALVGLLVGGAVALAAAGLCAAFLPVWALVLCTAAVPITCAVAASSSSDLAALLPFAAVGWIAFWLFVRQPFVRAWLTSSSDR